MRLAADGVLVLGFGLFSLPGAGFEEDEALPTLPRNGGGIPNQVELVRAPRQRCPPPKLASTSR